MNKARFLTGLCFSVALLTPLPSSAESGFDGVFERKSVIKIDWQPCYQNENPNLLCALYPVPLNYQKIHAGKGQNKTINIALVKLPANNPAKKTLGSLFLNPGGPGGSGVEFVRFAGQYLFNQEVRDQYDLIGFDPRGINLSEPVSCGLPLEQALEILQTNFPVTAEEESQRLARDKRLNAICKRDGNAIMDHMTTADVARDLDLLRQAVGDKLLHYVGYSYGSYLGVTYANLFPQNVGHLVVDGVLDPVQWATGKGWAGWIVPVSTRLGSDKGSMATLQEFFRLCDLAGAGGGCSFAGNSAARFDSIVQRLKTAPLTLVMPDGSALELTYALFISLTLRSTYHSPSWSEFADLLAFAEAQFPPHVIGEKYSQLRTELGIEEFVTPLENRIFGFLGVLCSDSTNPVDAEFWPLWAAETERNNGYFGPVWTWPSSTCSHWPGSQKSRFTGPFNRKTKNPVLVASTLFDPSTPYSGAQAVARLLPNSRLLTVAGWGHTTPGLSSCADSITANYLLYGDLPPVGTICKQEAMPFFIADGIDVFAGMIPGNASTEHSGRAKVGERASRDSAPYKSATEDSDGKRVRKAILRSQNRHFY